MPRSRRSLPQGHSFHITLRCNSRQFLLARQLRRDVLLVVLEKAMQKHSFRLYGVCLMANHIHLLLRPVTASQLPITEALPPSINTQAAVEHLFTHTLPSKVKALSKWKSIDIQRIYQHDTDYKRISNYLTKQTSPEHLSLDPFSSDLLPTYNRRQDAQ